MTIKIIGALLIVIGCGAIGMLCVIAHRREEESLRQLISALDAAVLVDVPKERRLHEQAERHGVTVSLDTQWLPLLVGFMVGGVLVGVCGSAISISKYLRQEGSERL